MNCKSCDTRIDYRFVTNCEHCGAEVKPAGLSQTDFQSAEPVQKRLTWRRRLGNLIYLLASSGAGMFTGSVTFFFGGALVFSILRGLDALPKSEGCGNGMFISFLVLVSGAFLGTVGGSVFAVKRPLFKGAGK